MKTKLDQISIPPLCRGMSEMAHTLVGKAVPSQVKVMGSNANEINLQGSRLDQEHHVKICVLVFFAFFLCFDFVPFMGIPENAGVT